MRAPSSTAGPEPTRINALATRTVSGFPSKSGLPSTRVSTPRLHKLGAVLGEPTEACGQRERLRPPHARCRSPRRSTACRDSRLWTLRIQDARFVQEDPPLRVQRFERDLPRADVPEPAWSSGR